VIRQISSLALAAALAAPMVFADRVQRAEQSRAETERLTISVPITEEARALVRSQFLGNARGLRTRQFSGRSAATEQQVLKPMPQAPGVTQINLFDSAREAFFVVTRNIPPGSTVQAFIIPPTYDGEQKQEFGLEALRVVDEGLRPGFSLRLPGIGRMGDFWKNGLTTYVVVVTDPGGAQSASWTDFVTGNFYRNAQDTSFVVPGINSFREFINGEGNTIVEIKGRFITGVRTEVLFEDQVAPQDAIQVIDSETIQVNVSRMPNFDVTLMKTYLLTVGQDGWSDIFPFRHTPR
jgi:hypothetical protein